MINNKEKIFVDIDETTSRTVEDGVYPYVNKLYGTNFNHETTTNYRDVFGNIISENGKPISREEKIKLFNGAILLDRGKNKIRPVDGSVEELRRLSKRFDISMLTARHPMLSEYSTEWVKHHFNSSVGKVLFSNCYHGGNRTKSSICLEKGVKIIIEDDLDCALELAQVGITVYLLAKPWNIQREEEHPYIIRVNSWADINL